jgi:hypothetical protein
MIVCSNSCLCGTKVLVGLNEAEGSPTTVRFSVPCPLCRAAVDFEVAGARPDQAPQTIAYEQAGQPAPSRRVVRGSGRASDKPSVL